MAMMTADFGNAASIPPGDPRAWSRALSIREMLRVVRRRWRILIATLLACSAIGVAYTLAVTPKYKSQVQLFVATEPSLSQAGALDLEEGNQFTESRVLSYVNLVTSPAVTAPVVKQLGLRMSPSQLAGELTASVPPDTVLINIVATNPSGFRARQIAQAVGQRMIRLVTQLENPGGRGSSPVRLTVSSPATLPTTPSSPNKKLDILLGIIAGVVLGLCLAVARERADDTVSDVEELKDHWQIPVLAVVPNVPEPVGLSVGGTAGDSRYEALRYLRTSLSFLNVDRPPDSLVITSSVPGEGKSTTAFALAEVVAAAGQSVILVDGDLRRPMLAQYSGLPTGPGVTDVLADEAVLPEVLLPHGHFPDLRILRAGSPVPTPSEILATHKMAELLERLRGMADLVIVDAPPLAPFTDAAVLAAQTSGALVVVQPRVASRRQLQDTLQQLTFVNARIFGFVANKVPSQDTDYSYRSGYYASSPVASAAATEA